MAIRRCPYCRAIIDEGLEYCSNCGTQLLFPEDELIEEEIPGEKILDEDEEEKAAKPSRGRKPGQKRGKAHLEKEKMKEIDFKPEAGEKEEAEAEMEPELEPELKPEEELRAGEPDEIQVEEEVGGGPADSQFDWLEEEPSEGVQQKELEGKQERAKIPDKAEEPGSIKEESEVGEEWAVEEIEKTPTGRDKEISEEDARKSLTSRDFEKFLDPAEKEKREIEKFLESVRRERGIKTAEVEEKKANEIPFDFEEKQIKTQDIGEIREPPEKKMEESPVPKKKEKITDTSELPPWASKIRGESSPEILDTGEQKVRLEPEVSSEPFEEMEKPQETAEEETIPTPQTQLGIPETVDQPVLPFSSGAETEEIKEKAKVRPSFRVPSRFKSRLFDILFIAALWAISIYIASWLTGSSVLQLISHSALPAVVFFFILLLTYLFLFLFFLGQTLGDQLFAHEE